MPKYRPRDREIIKHQVTLNHEGYVPLKDVSTELHYTIDYTVEFLVEQFREYRDLQRALRFDRNFLEMQLVVQRERSELKQAHKEQQ